MTTPQLCPHDDTRVCDNHCGVQQGTACGSGLISVAEAVRRFETEAIRGSFDTGRYRCGYFTWGSGPPLVFIHGMADLPASFAMPMSRLASQFRCIAYSLPEGGADGAKLNRLTRADLVADLFGLLDHLGIERTYLFGSSLGSTIVLGAMHARPARVARALLQGGFARRPLRLGERMLAGCARFWPGQMRQLPFRSSARLRHHHDPFASRPADAWEYFLACTGASLIRVVARRALMLHPLDLRPILPEIRQPVLLVCGDRDPLVGKECEEELLHGLPLARRIEIIGCGHYPYFSHPEVLAEIIRDFFTPPAEGEKTCRKLAAH